MNTTFWEPNKEIIEILVAYCKNNNYTKILEIGPGLTPFPLSSHSIDIDSTVENSMS